MSSLTDQPNQPTDTTQGFGDLLRRNVRQYGMLFSLLLIMLFFQFTTGDGNLREGVLLRPLNVTNLLLQNSYIVIMAIGMLLVIVSGHIDLSVGSIVGFVGGVAALMMVNYDIHWFPTVLVCLAAGTLIGAIQGYWVAYLGIPSFIVTLAGMLVFRGLSLALLQGQSIGPFPETFQRLSSGFIPDLFANEELHITTLILGGLVALALVVLSVRERSAQRRYRLLSEPLPFFVLKNLVVVAAIMYLCYLLASYRGLPNVVVIMFILLVLYTFITTQTTIGRRIYALGGNLKAAQLSGIKTRRLTFFTFMNLGFLAALAGLVFAARLNTATPGAGNAFELDVIAAAFIGGASATGGVGTVIGAVIGAFVMGVMNNGMSILGVGIDYQQVIKGLVLLLAVFFDVYNKNKGVA